MVGLVRSKLTYANVMATLALFVALGGGAYAAIEITGRDVKDRSLTGRDIKKRSVPINRVKGELPFYSKSESDGRFLARAGQVRIAVPPGGWLYEDPQLQETSGLGTERRQVFDYGQAGFADIRARVAVPTSLGGRPLELRGAELCYDATAVTVSLTGFEVRVYRSTTSLDAAPAVVASDSSIHDDQTCRSYTFSPVELTSADFLVPVVRATWSAPASFRLGRVTLVLEPG